jgi:DNA-directed RNA polymerase subunit RPC12/RpoP
MEEKDSASYHKEKCFRCGELVERSIKGTFTCPKCSFEWANLFIKRLPLDTFIVFKEYADNNFCSDYGFTLKSLIDSRANDELIRLLILKLEGLEGKVSQIENPKKTIKMVNGKEIKR